jgi:hypothetical protein
MNIILNVSYDKYFVHVSALSALYLPVVTAVEHTNIIDICYFLFYIVFHKHYKIALCITKVDLREMAFNGKNALKLTNTNL